MDNYKLTYLNLRGIAEPARLLFKYANVPFEDIRVDAGNWKAELKREFKWQQLPFLEYNGKILTQSQAIIKFLGRKFNLEPENAWEQAKCDEIYGAAYDLRCLFEPQIEAKFEGWLDLTKELTDNLANSSVPLILSNLNELLEELCTKKAETDSCTDFIFGGVSPTWVDFCLANFMEMFATALDEPSLLDNYPQLKKQQKAVYSLPRVAEWIAERPKAFI